MHCAKRWWHRWTQRIVLHPIALARHPRRKIANRISSRSRNRPRQRPRAPTVGISTLRGSVAIAKLARRSMPPGEENASCVCAKTKGQRDGQRKSTGNAWAFPGWRLLSGSPSDAVINDSCIRRPVWRRINISIVWQRECHAGDSLRDASSRQFFACTTNNFTHSL